MRVIEIPEMLEMLELARDMEMAEKGRDNMYDDGDYN